MSGRSLRARYLATLGVAVLGLRAGPAHAAEDCLSQHVEAVGSFEPAWTDELVRVCVELARLPDIDRSTSIRVVAGQPVVVVATLPDGRTAHREVRSPEVLGHTIEALVTLPATFSEAPRDPTPANDSKPSPPRAPRDNHDAAAETQAPVPLSISVELGLTTVGRVQGGTLYASFGPTLWASLNVSDWLFGLSARWDGYQTQPATALQGFEMMTFGAGLEVARRLRVHPEVAFDLGLAIGLVEEVQSAQLPQGETAGESTDVRLVSLTRMHIGGRGVRFTAELQGELSPLRVGRDLRIDEALPPLPAFGLGLGAGVSWQGP